VPRLKPYRHPRDIPAALHLTAPRRSFGPVLGMIIAVLIFQLSSPDTQLSRVITVVLQSSVVLLALRSAGAHPSLFRAGVWIVGGLLVLAILSDPFADLGPEVTGVISVALILVTPLAVVGGVVRELEEDGHVTVQTVLCGLCLYLLLGLTFAFIYAAVSDLSNDPFFAEKVAGTPNDYLYFSLTTLTTTGYGDFTAQTEFGRALSVTEALLGQIYLVTVLAVIVSNVRRRMPGQDRT
jgi:hypothetical protein